MIFLKALIITIYRCACGDLIYFLCNWYIEEPRAMQIENLKLRLIYNNSHEERRYPF